MRRGGRRLARSLAFLTLFEIESRSGSTLEEALDRRRESLEEEAGERLDDRNVEFARGLVTSTLARRDDSDALIHRYAPTFPIDQLPVTDRVALQLGIVELMEPGESSVGVIINEAVELAKTYGGQSSGRFVNGVLGTIAEGLGEAAETRKGSEGERPHH
jgi:N utilization substance protein B